MSVNSRRRTSSEGGTSTWPNELDTSEIGYEEDFVYLDGPVAHHCGQRLLSGCSLQLRQGHRFLEIQNVQMGSPQGRDSGGRSHGQTDQGNCRRSVGNERSDQGRRG